MGLIGGQSCVGPIPGSVAIKISGHKDRSAFERYNITDEKDLQNAAQRMREYLNGQSEKEK